MVPLDRAVQYDKSARNRPNDLWSRRFAWGFLVAWVVGATVYSVGWSLGWW